MGVDYAKVYKEDARQVALMLSQLASMTERWEFYMNKTSDGGDPYCDGLEVLERMGKLLSSLVIYQQEYEEEVTPQSEKKGKKKC